MDDPETTSAALTDEDLLYAVRYCAGNVVGIALGAWVSCQAVGQLCFSPDPLRPAYSRTIIACLILLACHVGCLIADTIATFGGHYGNQDSLYSYTTMYCLTEVAGGWIASCVQAIYAYRAWYLLDRKIWIAVPLVPLCLFTGASWSYAGFVTIRSNGNASDFAALQLGYIAAVAADVMIVFLMLLGLYRARAASQATTSRATRLLLRIVAVTISTNALTTAICIFQLSNSYTNLGALVVLDQSIPSIYLFSLLCWLLMRRKLAGQPVRPLPPSPSFLSYTDCQACGGHGPSVRIKIRGGASPRADLPDTFEHVYARPVDFEAAGKVLSPEDEDWAMHELRGT